ncbi:hypothetical protein NQZ68_019460 [Dissostichus eleginoides]|nr:hypothetical protein NQZ68_019460 [Dissostichus eleginoides]
MTGKLRNRNSSVFCPLLLGEMCVCSGCVLVERASHVLEALVSERLVQCLLGGAAASQRPGALHKAACLLLALRRKTRGYIQKVTLKRRALQRGNVTITWSGGASPGGESAAGGGEDAHSWCQAFVQFTRSAREKLSCDAGGANEEKRSLISVDCGESSCRRQQIAERVKQS